MISHVDMLLRISVGAVLGGVIGYERDRHRRPVGLRTHLIVAMASAMFMVVSTQFAYLQGYTHGGVVEVDGSRIAASVVSGVGFLAGGAVLRTGVTVQGLTTAAGLWLVTAIGMGAGAGMFVEAYAVTMMGMIALTVLRRFEDKEDHVLHRQLELMLTDPEALDRVLEALQKFNIVVTEVAYERRLDDEPRWVGATLDLKYKDDLSVSALLAALEELPGIRRLGFRARTLG